MYVYIYVCMYVCIYIYIYVYMLSHTVSIGDLYPPTTGAASPQNWVLRYAQKWASPRRLSKK